MKLFGKGGKLNIIDILVILIVVAALVFVGMKLTADDTQTLGSENAITAPNIRFTVLCEDVSAELAEEIMASLESEAQIIAGNTVEMTRLFYSNKLVDGKVIEWRAEAREDGRVDLYFTMEAVAVVSDGAYSVALQEIRIAKEFNVKTLGIEIVGFTLSMEKLG